jgi:hypothetical protein
MGLLLVDGRGEKGKEGGREGCRNRDSDAMEIAERASHCAR